MMSAPIKVTLPTKVIDLGHLGYDSTDRTEFLIKEARVRTTEVYVTAGLLAEMEETWGRSFGAVKTITDTVNQKVYVFPTDEEGDDIVPVRKSETLSSATFSFYVPLQKLKIKLRRDRQIVQLPEAVTVAGKGLAYCFNFAGVRATKRPRTPELEGAPAEGKTPQEQPDAKAKAPAQKPAAEGKAPAEQPAAKPTAQTTPPSKSTRAKTV